MINDTNKLFEINKSCLKENEKDTQKQRFATASTLLNGAYKLKHSPHIIFFNQEISKSGNGCDQAIQIKYFDHLFYNCRNYTHLVTFSVT